MVSGPKLKNYQNFEIHFKQSASQTIFSAKAHAIGPIRNGTTNNNRIFATHGIG